MRLAFSQRDQFAFVIFANHGIAIPITDACFFINDLQVLINTHVVLDDTTPPLHACITFAVRFLAA